MIAAITWCYRSVVILLISFFLLLGLRCRLLQARVSHVKLREWHLRWVVFSHEVAVDGLGDVSFAGFLRVVPALLEHINRGTGGKLLRPV